MPIRRVRPEPPAVPPAEESELDPPASPGDFEVGYKRPPKHTQFQPGCSGNPKGRPKRSKGLKTIIRETMLERIKIRTPRGEKSVSKAEALVLKKIEAAFKGNLKAIQSLLILFQEAVPDTP